MGDNHANAKGGSAPIEQHYTPEALAALLAVQPVTVRRWIKSGRLAAVRIGRALRIPAGAVGAVMVDARVIPEQLRWQGELMGKLARKRARDRRPKKAARGKRAGGGK